MARVEASSVKLKVRDGGLHVLRVGDERGCMAFLLPRASGQSGCDRLIFMLLREGHALYCGRPLRAERMAECKWFSRSFFTAWEAGRSDAIHRGGTQRVCFCLSIGKRRNTDTFRVRST